MKKRIIIAISLFILFSTTLFKHEIVISKFNIIKIKIDNNSIIKEQDLKNLLSPLLNKNLIFLQAHEVEKLLIQNSLIESFKVKKKYPNNLEIKVFEKKPIAILFNKKKRFYLSEKIETYEFQNYKDYKNLPLVFGDQKKFKIFYNDLKIINFPFDLVKKYTLYESDRWDLETINKIIIKLPSKNYNEKLKNFINIRDKKSFKKFKVFDYRIEGQLILK